MATPERDTIKEMAPQVLAGLPFVARVALGDDDREFLGRLVDTRREKIRRGQANVVKCLLLLAVAAWLALGGKAQIVLAGIGCILLVVSCLWCVQFTLYYRRQLRLLEADLMQNCVCRFEGTVGDAEHWLIGSGLLSNDAGRIQRVEVLPVSGKVHRTNDSLVWTWVSIGC
jgi:hypothetical protein